MKGSVSRARRSGRAVGLLLHHSIGMLRVCPRERGSGTGGIRRASRHTADHTKDRHSNTGQAGTLDRQGSGNGEHEADEQGGAGVGAEWQRGR